MTVVTRDDADLQELAERGMPLIGFHLPDGGVGRVTKGDEGYSFVPEV